MSDQDKTVATFDCGNRVRNVLNGLSATVVCEPSLGSNQVRDPALYGCAAVVIDGENFVSWWTKQYLEHIA